MQRHTPALWLRAPFTLCRGEQRLDLRAVPDCTALTPATIQRCIAIEGAIRHWRVVENRTSFERVAREHGWRMPCCGCPVLLRAGGWKA
ncbi:MAG: hypothetical protein M3436_18855 [Pseudomonadota bacterium]|nr:hypothetical protein [Pseudomonadota bacterium]